LLDGLPLALAQAATYLRETKLDTASYLRLYKQQWDDLMRYDGETGSPLIDYGQRSIGTTWTISFNAIKARNKNAANLLRLWAFIDNKDLWHGLLQTAANGIGQWPEWLCEMASNEVTFLGAARILLRYSMIEAEESAQGNYMIHPVVHRWTSYMQNNVEKREFLRLAVMVVGSSVPCHTSRDYWLLVRRLLPHAERTSWWMKEICEAEWSFNDIWALRGLNGLGNLYMHHARLKEAEAIYQRSLQGGEKLLGPDHVFNLTPISNLGKLYTDQGRLKEAEDMYKRAIQGNEEALGRDHVSTLNMINNLGILYRNQCRLKEAEVMYQQALQGKEKTLGSDHMSTLDTVNNLGSLYIDQHRLEEAEATFRRALQGYEKVLGPDHTSTITAVNNLGIVLTYQNRLKEAEDMFQRALTAKEKAFGQDNILTLDSVDHLGSIYAKQGQLKEAEEMYQRALQGYEEALGPDHRSTLNTVNNLGICYKNQGRLKEAEDMYQRALKGKEKALGLDHSSTLDTVKNLGNLYTDLGQLEEAEDMYQRALKGYEKVLGSDHTSVLGVARGLCLIYWKQGKLKEVGEMLARVDGLRQPSRPTRSVRQDHGGASSKTIASVEILPCKVCGKTESTRRCAQCKAVSYCGTEHQKADWKVHKNICISKRRDGI